VAEPMRKEEITTSDLVRDTRKQPEPVRNPAVEAGREVRQQDDAREKSREMTRPGGPEPVPETTNRRTVESGEELKKRPEPERRAEAVTPNMPKPQPEPGRADDAAAQLFSETQTNEFRARWSAIQTSFVDEPRKTVAEADKLVASLMTQLAEGFANERTRLEHQWDRGDDVSTEDLRVALKRYRSFFDRLLKA